MPLYRVRRERCIPYEILIEAPSVDEAEILADRNQDKWEEGCAYWQDLETYTLEEGDSEPVLTVESEKEEE